MSQAAPPSIPRGEPTMLHAAALRPRSKLRAGTSTGQKLDKTGQNWAKLDKNWTNGSGPESPQLDKNCTKTEQKLNKWPTGQKLNNWTKGEKPLSRSRDPNWTNWTKLDETEQKLDKLDENWTKTGQNWTKLDKNWTNAILGGSVEVPGFGSTRKSIPAYNGNPFFS